MLLASLKSCMQAQQAAPHEATSVALVQLLSSACDIAARMQRHKLHALRHSVARTMRSVLAITRSPVPVLPKPHHDASAHGSLAQRALHAVRDAAAEAQPALDRILQLASSAGSAEKNGSMNGAQSNAGEGGQGPGHDHESAGSAAQTEPSSVAGMEVETSARAGAAAQVQERSTQLAAAVADGDSAIGWYLALLDKFNRNGEWTGLLHDLAVQGAPWALTVQALQHPDMQSITDDAPALVRQKHCPLGDVAPRLHAYVARLEDTFWQVRAEVVALLRGFWYRCVTPSTVMMSVHSQCLLVCVAGFWLLSSCLAGFNVFSRVKALCARCSAHQWLQELLCAGARRFEQLGPERRHSPQRRSARDTSGCLIPAVRFAQGCAAGHV